jgi:hypothetical protein
MKMKEHGMALIQDSHTYTHQGANTMKITIERDTLQAALDALDHLGNCSDRDVSPEEWNVAKAEQACNAMRRALAQPAQCQICNGDDMQAPCAYPSEGLSGCLRVAAIMKEN